MNKKKAFHTLRGVDSGDDLTLKELRHEIGGGVYSIRSALLNVRQDPNLAEEVLRFALDKLVRAISEIDRVRRRSDKNSKNDLGET